MVIMTMIRDMYSMFAFGTGARLITIDNNKTFRNWSFKIFRTNKLFEKFPFYPTK